MWYRTSVLLTCFACLASSPDGISPWRDPSPHAIQLVAVDQSVRLEVLDWGGAGTPLVLLAGSGNTAHVFDDLAPKLTACCHVYGITRRGYGASSRPPSGYGNQRLADDILQVLDALSIVRPVLVGHSMAGGEITTLANQHSDRLSGLIYLDALGDPRDFPASDPEFMALVRKLPPGPPSPPCPEDRSSFPRYRATLECQMKFAFPEAELRNLYAADPDGSVGDYVSPPWIHDAIGAGEVKRDYSHVRVPAMAIYEFPRSSLSELRPDDPQPRNEGEREVVLKFGLMLKAYVDRWVSNLQSAVPDARLVNVPAAGHYLFLTRQADVAAAITDFVSHLAKEKTLASVTRSGRK
jgi:non-heme chloroperoxidase